MRKWRNVGLILICHWGAAERVSISEYKHFQQQHAQDPKVETEADSGAERLPEDQSQQ